MVAPGTLTMPLASFLISSLGVRTWVPKLPAWRPVGTLGCGGQQEVCQVVLVQLQHEAGHAEGVLAAVSAACHVAAYTMLPSDHM